MTQKWECKCCGKCCISLTDRNKFCIPLTKQDAQEIRKTEKFKALKAQGKIDIVKGTYDYMYPYDMVAKGICPFFDKETRLCTIHNEPRPSGCKTFTCNLEEDS